MSFNMKTWMVIGIVSLALGGCTSHVEGGDSGGGGSGGNGSGGMGMGGSGTAGGGGGGSGVACGGFAGLTCTDTEYCDFPDDICGAVDGQGVCRARPQGCTEEFTPTCACDGMIYGNQCQAAAQGFDLSNLGGCMSPDPGQFNCGHAFCDAATQYCRRTNADTPNTPDSFSCFDYPMACSGMTPSCACIGDQCGAPMLGMCMATGTGFTVTCPGG